MFLIDSSAWIEFLRPKGSLKVKERIREILQKDEGICCGIIVVEVTRGAKTEGEFLQLKESLMALPQIPIDGAVVDMASNWGFLLERKGRTVSTTDILIAAAAYGRARVIHLDKDFKQMSEVVGLEEEMIGWRGR